MPPSSVLMTGVVQMNSHGLFTSYTSTTLTLRHNRFSNKAFLEYDTKKQFSLLGTSHGEIALEAGECSVQRHGTDFDITVEGPPARM